MDAITLCDIKKAYTDIYVNTQQLLLNTTLFYTWRHVSAAHISAKPMIIIIGFTDIFISHVLYM